MKTYKRVCLLLLAFLLAAAPLVLPAGAGVFGTKPVFGCRFLNVLTASMEPAFHQGDMIVVKSCAPEDVRVGDDITYATGNDALITHRVKDIITERGGEQGLWFVTQGVNNTEPDYEPVEAAQLVGKVTMRLPGLGAAMSWLRGHLAIAILAALLLIFLSWPAAILLALLALRGRKNRP